MDITSFDARQYLVCRSPSPGEPYQCFVRWRDDASRSTITGSFDEIILDGNVDHRGDHREMGLVIVFCRIGETVSCVVLEDERVRLLVCSSRFLRDEPGQLPAPARDAICVDGIEIAT